MLGESGSEVKKQEMEMLLFPGNDLQRNPCKNEMLLYLDSPQIAAPICKVVILFDVSPPPK